MCVIYFKAHNGNMPMYDNRVLFNMQSVIHNIFEISMDTFMLKFIRKLWICRIYVLGTVSCVYSHVISTRITLYLLCACIAIV